MHGTSKEEQTKSELEESTVHMPTTTIEKLREALKLGLGIVTEIASYSVKDWVTSLFADDIDGDGYTEIVAGSNDGRVYGLYCKTGGIVGKWRQNRIIGAKDGVNTVASYQLESCPEARIIVGTQDKKVYVLDKDGHTITRNCNVLLFDRKDGRTIDQEQEQKAHWCNTSNVIRQILVDPLQPSEIIISSEDLCAYSLDYQAGEPLWRFETSGDIRAICFYSVNRDKQAKILVGSSEGYLYLLDRQGKSIVEHRTNYPIHKFFVADIDGDKQDEILVASDDKDLIALVYQGQETNNDGFVERWRRSFDKRLLALCVTDIDGDGSQEIITSSEDKHIYILDAEGNILWRHDYKYRVFSICPVDLDKDGLPELLIGTEENEDNYIRAMKVQLSRGIEEKIRDYYQELGERDRKSLCDLTVKERALLQDILPSEEKELATLQQVQEFLDAGEHSKALSRLLELEQQKVARIWHIGNIGHIDSICLRHVANQTEQEFVVGVSNGDIYAFTFNGNRVSSICFRATSNPDAPEILIGTEDKKLSVYSSDLQRLKAEIQMEENVRLVRASRATKEDAPEIMVAGLSNHIYAYTRDGKFLWSYQTRDYIKAVCIRDINGDGQTEILVGSEDRNIHVLDSAGHLLWRYYLPHSVLAIDAAATGRDGMIEIFVGCADGNLYVFNREGDLCWTYQVKDRIHAVRVEDFDGDGNFEIALGSEDEFELLRVVNQQQLMNTVRQCWMQLYHQTSLQDAIASLLESNDPFLQAFALDRLVEQDDLQARNFDPFVESASAKEVRKKLAPLVPTLYQFNTVRASKLLRQLSTDIDIEVRNAMIERLPAVMYYDWDEGFYYLRLAAENSSRFVRRIAVRKIDELIRTSSEVLTNKERRHQIFSLLLATAQDQDSEWVRQEAARALAHYLDQHWGNFIVYIHLFIVKNLHPNIWELIEHTVISNVIRDYIHAVIPLLSNLDENNVQEKLQQMIQAQLAAENLLYGKDIHLIYRELYRLFTLETLEEISKYQCEIRESQFHPNNQYARNVLPVFKELYKISRPLTMYFRREDLQDRLNGLLDALVAIDRISIFLDLQYSVLLLGGSMKGLPDYRIFLLLFKKWKVLLQVQLNELRGRAELRTSLLTRDIRKEEQVGIWVAIKNVGRSSASDVKVTLLHSDSFETVEKNTFETEIIAAGEETSVEFILRPCSEMLNLKFEIVFDGVEVQTNIEIFEDRIELREWREEFRQIPNPYSTGTPTYDSNLFYGRENDMALLKDNLTRDVKSVVVLYGQRRSGKTSLLVQLANFSRLGAHIPVLLDMQRVSYRANIENVLSRIAHTIERAMKQKDIAIAAPKPADFKDDPIYTFDLFLDQIEERLTKYKLIMLIDEFEEH